MNRMLAALILALLLGCGSSEPTEAPLPEGPDAAMVPPAEMRGILEGLRSPLLDRKTKLRWSSIKSSQVFIKIVVF